MSDVIRIVDRDGVVGHRQEPGGLLPVPSLADLSGGAVTIREAVEGDIPFIDALQKANSVGVGFMFAKQLEGHIAQGHVILAEDALERPVGYCIGVDRATFLKNLHTRTP
ncbi:MAG: hypothetical protein AAGA29_10525 [Planctomycetota bacterium]